ncbi:MAG: ABC transporter ATP-binding protein [Vicinamibacterales bacterium]
MPDAIVLRRLTKTFGQTVAVSDLDLVVPQGALYGVIGPNGAGKTTAIRMILSIILPDSGDLAVLGHRSALEAKDRIGYLPEERGLYKKMRVAQFLTYLAQLKNADGEDLPRRIEHWLERVGLAGAGKKRCDELSKGMQQKVQFVSAVLHRPDLLILDEPFSGLDPVSQRQLRDLVREEHRRGATVLFSTHVMTHAEQLCDHVVMIHRGKKVLDDGIQSIRARYSPRSLLFEPLNPDADLQPLGGLRGVARARQEGSAWELCLAEGADPARVIRDVAMTVPPARIELRRPTLEDVFVDIVTGGDEAGVEDSMLREAVRDDADGTGGREARL